MKAAALSPASAIEIEFGIMNGNIPRVVGWNIQRVAHWNILRVAHGNLRRVAHLNFAVFFDFFFLSALDFKGLEINETLIVEIVLISMNLIKIILKLLF